MSGKRKLYALSLVMVLELVTLVLAFSLAMNSRLTADFASIATVVAGGAAMAMLGFAGGNAVEHWAKKE